MVAGDRRRPAASTKTVEPDMTSSLVRIGVPADPRRTHVNPQPTRLQRLLAGVEPALALTPGPLKGAAGQSRLNACQTPHRS
jgi:hypothetical protein